MRPAKVVLTVLVLVLLGATPVSSAGGWEETLDALLAAPAGPGSEEHINEVAGTAPGWSEVAARIGALVFAEADSAGRPVLRSHVCADTVERPWVFRLPAGYDPAVPTPLLVVLHGGASTPELYDDPTGYILENELAVMAYGKGWISAAPFAQAGATWWDDVGMGNIRDLVRAAKSEFNVDDDRVWMGGFSDGASAGFLHAMVAPTDYAAVLALNGHMGVGSLDGDLPTYATSMSSTPVFATTTLDDELYPSRKMRSSIAMARDAGADILYRELPGAHDFDDVAGEIPAMAAFLERHPRDPFPSELVWEAGDTKFGLCRWFAIDRVTTDEPSPWHVDHNVALVDDRVTVGFHPDYAFEGPGILVAGLSEGDYPASQIGLMEGDVIVRAGDVRTDSLANLNEWKETVERGDPFEMTVLRDGDELVLGGALPEPSGYLIFKRDVPSALARVRYSANRVDVEASRLGAFRVLVHPEMFALDQSIVIAVNGEVVFDDVVEPDIAFMLRNFLANRDRKLLYVAEVAVELQ